MWAREILADEGLYFVTARIDKTQLGRAFVGDIFVFGREDPGDSPVFHLAMHTGKADERGDPLLLHTTDLNGSHSVIWPLDKFKRYPRYEKLHAVKRLKPELFQVHIAPFI